MLEKEIREIWDKCHQESEILKYLVCSNVEKRLTHGRNFRGELVFGAYKTMQVGNK